MSINLLEVIQKNLDYPVLHKIDPNTQHIVHEKTIAEDKFSQAAIPAVLTGLYKFAQSDEGATGILHNDYSTNWTDKIFYDKRDEVIKAVSTYSKQSNSDSIAKMNDIADEAVRIVRENLPANAAIKEVKVFFSNQRNNILLYLLPELNMGELLHDDTLDDNTHKMEGPISSLMQSIGAAFSNPVTGEEIKNQ